MPRFEIKGDPISIAYGVCEQISSGVFISVYDRRLETDSNASDEVNQVAFDVGVHDGGGSYFDLHTGQTGFGKKVSKDTMRVYLLRYGVENKRIDELFTWWYGKPIGSTCSVCYKEDTKTCAKCHKMFYCSKECQLKDWPKHKLFCKSAEDIENLVTKETVDNCVVCSKKTERSCGKCGSRLCGKECQIKIWSQHKLFCNALPFPVRSSTEKSVYAFLLPENGEKVVLVNVEIEQKFDEDDQSYWNSPQLKPFISSVCGTTYMTKNPFNQKRLMKDMLIIEYNDNFLNDGSKSNKVVQKLTNGKCPHDWRGPIVVMKAKETTIDTSQHYIDIGIKDFPNVVDFFTQMYEGRS